MLSDIDRALYSAESLEFKGEKGEGQTSFEVSKIFYLSAYAKRLYKFTTVHGT
jgi:hypothetical protein